MYITCNAISINCKISLILKGAYLLTKNMATIENAKDKPKLKDSWTAIRFKTCFLNGSTLFKEL
jgi:hypothetical protein